MSNRKPRQKKSIFWSYFQQCDTDEKKAVCLICKTLVCYSGNSSNIKKHLERNHLIHYQNLINDEEADSENTRRRSPRLKLKQQKQKLLTSFCNASYEYAPKYPTDSKQYKDITKSLMYMITKDLQPFSIVEDSGFKKFVLTLDNRYELPSRNYLSTNVLNEMYVTEKQIVMDKLQLAKNVHITTDMWTDTKNQLAYIAVTVHYIENMQLYSYNIKTCNFPERHTAINIHKDLSHTFQEWKITDKVHCVITDNGANVIAAIKIGKWQSLPCFAHTLNLIVQDSLKDLNLDVLIKKCRLVVHIFKSSTLATTKLNEYQNRLNIKVRTLKNDIVTRWNSTLTMLKSVNDLKEVLPTVLSTLNREDTPTFIFSDWETIEQIIKILNPFDLATKDMSAEKYVTCSKIIPIVKCIISQLISITNISNDVQTLKTNLLNQIQRRMGILEQNHILALATILDPRFKAVPFASDEALRKCKRQIVTEMVAITSESQIEDASIEIETNQNLDTENETPVDTLWSYIDKKIAANKQASSVQEPLIRAEREAKRYFEHNTICRNDDPLKWWYEIGSIEYPIMKILAEKYLSIPATSVPSERVFSKSGLVVSDRRSKISPNKVNQVVFLNMNIK